MHPEVKSLSPGKWLQLPIYGFDDWLKEEEETQGVVAGGSEERANGRVSLGSVARYYQSYVKKMELDSHLRNNVTVTQASLLCPKSKSERRSQSCESTFSFTSTSSRESDHNTRTSSPEITIFRPCQSGQTTLLDTGGQAIVGETRDEEEEVVSSNDEIEVPTVSDSDDTGISCCTKQMLLSPKSYRWVVRGRTVDGDGQEGCVCVCAKNLVLATGVEDSPKKLGVPGEDHRYVRHSFSDISPDESRRDRPVLVVGAGLAAADAVSHNLSQGHSVVHVFHQDTSDQRLLYHTMDPSTYTEYVTLFQKMSGRLKDPSYTPLPQHRVLEFAENGLCTVHSIRDGTSKNIKVSLALVLIGGQTQLDFLPECMTRQLGLHPDQPIDTKHNPMDLDPYTFESENFPSLFALGPLAGDNFVRFVLGGAIGITKKLRENF